MRKLWNGLPANQALFWKQRGEKKSGGIELPPDFGSSLLPA